MRRYEVGAGWDELQETHGFDGGQQGPSDSILSSTRCDGDSKAANWKMCDGALDLHGRGLNTESGESMVGRSQSKLWQVGTI